MPDVILQDAGPNRIAVIQVVRVLTRLGLKEGKELVESAPKVLLQNVDAATAAQAVAALTRAGAQATVVEAGAGAADEQEADAIWDDDSSAASGPAAAAGAGVAAGGAPTACELVVLDAGRNKIATIKAIRELTGWGLAEAKGCADRAGSVVLRGPRAQLAAGLAKLQSAGARGEIRGA